MLPVQAPLPRPVEQLLMLLPSMDTRPTTTTSARRVRHQRHTTTARGSCSSHDDTARTALIVVAAGARLSDAALLAVKDVWTLSIPNRHRLFALWRTELRTKTARQCDDAVKAYDAACAEENDLIDKKVRLAEQPTTKTRVKQYDAAGD